MKETQNISKKKLWLMHNIVSSLCCIEIFPIQLEIFYSRHIACSLQCFLCLPGQLLTVGLVIYSIFASLILAIPQKCLYHLVSVFYVTEPEVSLVSWPLISILTCSSIFFKVCIFVVLSKVLFLLHMLVLVTQLICKFCT